MTERNSQQIREQIAAAMTRDANGDGTPLDPNRWRIGSAMLTGTVISFDVGGVQFIGREPLGIEERVISVQFAQLFQIVAAIIGTLDPQHPAHQAARVALFPTATKLESANGAPR